MSPSESISVSKVYLLEAHRFIFWKHTVLLTFLVDKTGTGANSVVQQHVLVKNIVSYNPNFQLDPVFDKIKMGNQMLSNQHVAGS